MTIQIARHAVDLAWTAYARESGPMFMTVQLDFRGYRISVALRAEIVPERTPTSFMGLGDFSEGSIRVYQGDRDVTQEVFGRDEFTNATADTLFEVMQVLKDRGQTTPPSGPA